MPHVHVRRNMLKVHGVLAQVDEVLGGLTRGLDLSLLDAGIGMVAGRAVSFFPRGDAIGVVLPNNSPGVHSLWAPTTVLKIPLVLKPGSAEPWTPLRIIQAWLDAGCPPEAFSFYPCDHAGGNEILRRTGRGMVFGDVKATERWRKEGGRVEIHGPGFSKVILGADALANWEQHIDSIAASVADNGGRSCVNASGVWVTGKGREIAEALAKKLATITPRAADDRRGRPGAVRRSARRRARLGGDRQGPRDAARRRGRQRLDPRWQPGRPVGAWRHLPAADRAALRPRAPAGQPRIPVPVRQRRRGPRGRHAGVPRPLAGRHRDLGRPGAACDRLIASPLVDRLNIGAVPTTQIGWDQPHEGNLFEHLYAQARDPARRVMRILSLTAGAASMYCGSCLRDNALAAELIARGHDVTLLPVYTPTLTDEPNVSGRRVFFGGVSVYLQQHFAFFRTSPRWLDRLWDSARFIRIVSRRSIQTDGKFLGGMTVSMLKGERRPAAQGARQADRLAEDAAQAGRRDPAVRAADRPRQTDSRGARGEDRVHAAGRGSRSSSSSSSRGRARPWR